MDSVQHPIERLSQDLQTVASKLATQDLVGLDDAAVEGLISDLHRAESTLRAATVRALAELGHRGLHLNSGQRSVGGYLAHRQHLRRDDAAATGRLAIKHRFLPHTMAALEAGEITEAHAQVIGRAWRRPVVAVFDRDETMMVERAAELSFQDFVWFIEKWKDAADPDRGRRNAERAVSSRRLHISGAGDRVYLNGSGDSITGTLLKGAIDRVSQELFEQDWKRARREHGDDATSADVDRTPAQRRYDALLTLVKRGCSAAPDGKPPEPLVHILCDQATFNAALTELAGGRPTYPTDRTCELLDGTPITPIQAIEQALRGYVARVVFGSPSIVIDAGRTRRLFTKRMKAILGVRDRHCCWPGCDMASSRCEADHIDPWEGGGATDVANGHLLCTYHHRLRRRPKPFRVTRRPDGTSRFHRPDGTEIS
jgi:hypothetical protein